MILLPVLALLAWGHAFHRLGRGWLESVMAAFVVFGVAVSVAAELQSLTATLTSWGSAAVWLLVAAAALVVVRRRGAQAAAPREPGETFPFAALGAVAALLAITGFVAFVAAPNSFDGLTYHMMRPERWIQQGSLEPFPTHDTRQLFMPSWPEYAILQLRLLSGHDRFANLVQWTGFVGSIGGAAMLARALGGGRVASIGAAVLVTTLPLAVAQSTGTQTDVVAAWWAVTACAFGYRLVSRPVRRSDAVLAGLSLGLAAATKQTAFVFAVLGILPAAWLLVRQGERRMVAGWLATSGLAVVLLAGPQLFRNWRVFGNVRGDPAVVSAVAMGTRAPNQVAANMLRNLAVHFGTPWSGLNEAAARAAGGASRAIGANPSDPRTTWAPPFAAVPWTTHEELAGNPLHLLVILAGATAVMVSGKDVRRRLFLGALVAGFVTYCTLFKWQIYSGRLHTPLFVMALGLVAVELERLKPVARRLLLGLLFLAVLPTALVNYTRPLVAVPRITPRPGILAVPRNFHYFMYMPHLGRGYRDVALRIAGTTCTDVGVRAWPDAWEYAVLALARNAGSQATFRSIDVTNVSARFARDSSPPCLLLQIGPYAGRLPEWASDWRTLADYSAPLGVRGVALYAPDDVTSPVDSLRR